MKSIGDIDAGRGKGAKPSAERQTWRWVLEALLQRRERCSEVSGPCVGEPALHDGQPRRGIAGRARHAEQIARPSTTTAQALALRHETHHLHTERQRPSGGVTSDKGHLVRTRQRAETCAEFGEPAFIDGGQGQRQQRPGGRCTHGRNVAEIDGERAMTDRSRRRSFRKMHALDQGVADSDKIEPRRRSQDRAVVTDAKRHVAAGRARGAKVTLDEGEFTEWH